MRFRDARRNRNLLEFEIPAGDPGEEGCGITVYTNGNERNLGVDQIRLVDHKWYTARVRVRRSHIECTLYDGKNGLVRLEANDDNHPSGQVSFGTYESSFRFKNIKVTAPDGKILWEMPPSIRETTIAPRADGPAATSPEVAVIRPARQTAQVESGTWRVVGNELVQTDATPDHETRIIFGSFNWTDYDFEVELLRERKEGVSGLLYRRIRRNGNSLNFLISEGEACSVHAFEDGEHRVLKRVGFHQVSDRWYRARVTVRGNQILSTLRDLETGVELVHLKAEDKDNRHPTGQVGLAAEGSSYRFRNIKITTPDNKILWTGLPDRLL